MAQFHHVVYYDTAKEAWRVEPNTPAFFPDGEVWDYAGDQEWGPVPDNEEESYMHDIAYIEHQLNSHK